MSTPTLDRDGSAVVRDVLTPSEWDTVHADAQRLLDPDRATTRDIGPLDGMLFENCIWHAGGRNTSGQPRLAVMARSGGRWCTPVDEPVPELLAEPGFSAVQRQLRSAPDRRPDASLAKGRGAKPLRHWHADHDTAVA